MRVLFTTASVLACMASGALAATCNVVASGQFSCEQLDSAPIVLGDDDVARVTSTGSIVSDKRKKSPVTAEGDNTLLVIDAGGSVEQRANKGQAVLGSGDGLTVVNSGQVMSGDRGIVMDGGSRLDVKNAAGAVIMARRQAVRAGTDSPGASVENNGTIQSTEGRALQLRSFGATVVNNGALIGGEEVVEARGDFTLYNYGTIRLIDPSIEDEDAVQFAGGYVENHGLIEGSDDGVDMDEGTVVNRAGAIIRSTGPASGNGSGIDIDEVYDDGINPERAAKPITVLNAGTIEGAIGIGADEAATSSVYVTNSGRIVGHGGTAINLAVGQGASKVSVSGDSTIVGDVLFGNSNDVFAIGALTSGNLVQGLIDGRGGNDIAELTGYSLMDLSNFVVTGSRVSFDFLSAGLTYSASFLNFENWKVGGETYTTAALEKVLASDPAPVPLPAGLPLLLLGLGGLAMVRRR